MWTTSCPCLVFCYRISLSLSLCVSFRSVFHVVDVRCSLFFVAALTTNVAAYTQEREHTLEILVVVVHIFAIDLLFLLSSLLFAL